MKLTSRRYVAAAGLATLATFAVSALALTAANATSPRLEVITTSIRGAAGTCTVVVITPRDVRGVDSTVSETATVLLSESPSDGNQDLDFCVSDPADPTYKADTPTEDPSY